MDGNKPVQFLKATVSYTALRVGTKRKSRYRGPVKFLPCGIQRCGPPLEASTRPKDYLTGGDVKKRFSLSVHGLGFKVQGTRIDTDPPASLCEAFRAGEHRLFFTTRGTKNSKSLYGKNVYRCPLTVDRKKCNTDHSHTETPRLNTLRCLFPRI